MNGSICGFTCCCPTDEELESCHRFQISDKNSWDPSAKIFISSVTAEWGEDGYIASEISQHINQVKKLSHDDLIFSDSHYFHDFDRALAHSSLAPNQMSDRMVADVISDKRHHGTDVNLLSRKWGIGLKKAKDTYFNSFCRGKNIGKLTGVNNNWQGTQTLASLA
ncbi:predicted protein [Chaetoceros tenuissimus]|uniref:Uncharacterized protein n=2 Tax=Chaetoceros tenuissimus TaxID=426638 RepID=A0AAD3CD57_9STRA|nr:predicted protein [Chaetoceros tenuissimus]GFH43571.1 predicted protein [Chaetoceros tenuissimus]GFH43573.1 predicted protein [Chaetoceros tenuissimus]GFH50508.1 predicted protein [Chaetoceros tenuissimus]GFH50510.1 predicted protein [Chaetoceros tenuissimus]